MVATAIPLAFWVLAIYIPISMALYAAMMHFFKPRVSTNLLEPNSDSTKLCTATVVVCFRNEEEHLSKLLNCLTAQSYPASLFNIVLYNDGSTDNSKQIVQDFIENCSTHKIECIDLIITNGSASAKKSALMQVAQNSSSHLIAVCDADCIYHKNWLQNIVQTYTENEALMVCGNVFSSQNKTWLQQLQHIELLALAAVTKGGIINQTPIMCNGANMAFDRLTFNQINPYANNLHISSGDDLFLLFAMQQIGAEYIQFVNHSDAIVHSPPKNTVSDYFAQHLRWTAKTKHFNNKLIKTVAIVVLHTNLLIVLSTLLLFTLQIKYVFLFFIIVLIKTVIDYRLVKPLLKSSNQKLGFGTMYFYQPIEAIFSTAIAVFSILGISFTWKNRKLKS